jgi:hypothetical protein
MCKVWWKRQDEWRDLYEGFSLDDCLRYAAKHIHWGGITQRIEIRESASGEVVRVAFDSSWK